MFFMAVTPDWRLITTTVCFQLLLVSDIYSSRASTGTKLVEHERQWIVVEYVSWRKGQQAIYYFWKFITFINSENCIKTN